MAKKETNTVSATMSLKERLAQRTNQSSKVQSAFKTKETKSFVDPTEWKPELDKKAGKTTYVIRFLSDPFDDDKTPVKEFKTHFFSGPGGYYTEYSRSTIGATDDPVYLLNKVEFANPANKGKYPVYNKTTKRLTTKYKSNIIVIKDPLHPENESTEEEPKVFKFTFGAEIYKKLKDAADGNEAAGEDPFNPFDISSEGKDFILVVEKKALPEGGETITYIGSKFSQKSSPVSFNKKEASEECLEKIIASLYDIEKEIVSKVKTAEELTKILNRVLSEKTNVGPKVDHRNVEVNDSKVTKLPWGGASDEDAESEDVDDSKPKSRWEQLKKTVSESNDEDDD